MGAFNYKQKVTSTVGFTKRLMFESTNKATIGEAIVSLPVIQETPYLSGSNGYFCNLIWTGSLFFVTDANSTSNYYTTPDFTTWTTRSMPVVITQNQEVAYGASIFVCFGGNSNTSYYTSPDGITWTTRTLPQTISSAFGKIFFANNMFFMFSSNFTDNTKYYTSTNGTTWTARTITAGEYPISVDYFNGQYIANFGGYWRTSGDGITWTANTPLSNLGSGIVSVDFFNGKYSIIAINTTCCYYDVYTSTDLSSLTLVRQISPSQSGILLYARTAFQHNGTFLLFMADTVSGYCQLYIYKCDINSGLTLLKTPVEYPQVGSGNLFRKTIFGSKLILAPTVSSLAYIDMAATKEAVIEY